MGLFHVNGMNMYAEIRGEGEPMILIHGLTGDHTQWNPQVEWLSKSFQTIAVDCRGHGLSDKPQKYSLADHVQDILSLMDTLQLGKAHLYGVSMGSYIAQGVAIEQPHRVKSLILAVPKSNGRTSSTQRLISEHAAEFAGLNEEERGQFLFRHMVYNLEVLRGEPEQLKNPLSPAETEAANKALEGFDFRGDLHRITARTLVVSGKHDGLNPPSEGRLVASLIPGAAFVEMQYSGHLPMLEEPEEYDRVIREFLVQ